jgi:hypothetical protein
LLHPRRAFFFYHPRSFPHAENSTIVPKIDAAVYNLHISADSWAGYSTARPHAIERLETHIYPSSYITPKPELHHDHSSNSSISSGTTFACRNAALTCSCIAGSKASHASLKSAKVSVAMISSISRSSGSTGGVSLFSHARFRRALTASLAFGMTVLTIADWCVRKDLARLYGREGIQ